MELKSEYFANLSADAKVRYESKVTSTGLGQDPYARTESPENIPKVQ